MYRLDKACDLSPFVDTESTRYALSAVRFRPPAGKKLRERYLALRAPQASYRTVTKPAKHGAGTRTVREFAGMVIMPAAEAISKARSEMRATVEATNGRYLISVPCLNGDEFPETPGAGIEPQEALIPGTYLKQAIQRIPRKAHREVLRSVRVTQAPDRNHVVLSTTDWERSTDETIRQVEGRFPQTDQIWPSEPPETSITVCPTLLETLIKHAKTNVDPEKRGVKVILRGHESAIEFRYHLTDGREAKALLMPMTTDD